MTVSLILIISMVFLVIYVLVSQYTRGSNVNDTIVWVPAASGTLRTRRCQTVYGGQEGISGVRLVNSLVIMAQRLGLPK